MPTNVGHRNDPLQLGPWLFVLVSCLGIGLAGNVIHRWSPEIVNDSGDYLTFPFDSISQLLAHRRTPGYPLLLRALSLFVEPPRFVPVLNYVTFCGGVVLFYVGLASLTGSRWTSALCAISLLSANTLHLYVHTVATDTVAAGTAVGTIGLLWRYLAAERDRGGWLALVSLGSAACWLIRPAYLFIVPLIPLLAFLIPIGLHRSDRATRNRLGTSLTLTVAVMFPLLVWCTFRWIVVGQFGVVSFGGYNLVGIAGQLLDDRASQEMDEHFRPLASAALRRRNQLPAQTLTMQDSDPLNYMRMEQNYDLYIWSIYQPAAVEVFGEDNRTVNNELRAFALASIRLRPASYLIWLAKSFRQAIRKLVGDFVVNPYGLLAITVLSLLATWRAAFGGSSRPIASTCPSAVPVLLITSTGYALSSLVETILVCPPLGRMTDAAAVFLPSLATAAIVTLVQRPSPARFDDRAPGPAD